MQWWCSAQGVAWSWTWRPYLGVWILVAATVLAYARLTRRTGGASRSGILAFGAGMGCLWLALDWPIGALAAGYLASVHMLQFLLVALIAPPLLLLGLPDGAWERLSRRGRVVSVLRRVTHPLFALILYNVVIWITHWPRVVDGLMGFQAGSFLIDMLWIAGGLVFWWPLVAPVPQRPGFTPPIRIAYLIFATVTSTGPFLYLTFTRLPVYATYELAPPIPGITKREDQQAAGLLMKIGGGLILWTAIGVVFARWYRSEDV